MLHLRKLLPESLGKCWATALRGEWSGSLPSGDLPVARQRHCPAPGVAVSELGHALGLGGSSALTGVPVACCGVLSHTNGGSQQKKASELLLCRNRCSK